LPAAAHFVLAGDLNADPDDGDAAEGAIAALLTHPRVAADFVPRSQGAVETAKRHGIERHGDVASHTGDFGPRTGTMRLDYVLPSRSLTVRDGGVFWPQQGERGADWCAASDHRMVWLDLGL
jgi:endonuclease/exonuclease/phosphatase family metal-dependent hydrolase